jgi:transcriptional regulator NrdR family protein
MHEGGTLIVKRISHSHHGKAEHFNPEKLHNSILAACLSCGVPAGHAESIARQITGEVAQWLNKRPEVTSEDLRRTATHFLKTHHPDAAYLYEHHRSTL